MNGPPQKNFGGVFPYEELLAFYRGEVRPSVRRAEIERLVRHDPRWKAHWESIEFLDLERAAAMQDGQDLQQFSLESASEYCRTVARTEGSLFEPLVQGLAERDATGLAGRGEWASHMDDCVYCRRMWRLAHARAVSRRTALPEDELLLREWLLQDYYQHALQEVTEQVKALETPPFGVFLILLRGGDLVGVGNGQRHLFHVAPRGAVAGWDYDARLAQRPLPATLASSGSRTLQFERQLNAGRGRLELQLRVTPDRQVICDAEIIPPGPASETARDLILTIDCQGLRIERDLSEGARRWYQATLPAADFLAGQRLRLCVYEGPVEDRNRVEEFSIRFAREA